MANKSESILIYLRALGAAKARRDIKSVADETRKLNDEVSRNTRLQGSNNKANEAQTAVRKDSVKALRTERQEIERLQRRQTGYLNTLEKQVKVGNVLPKQVYDNIAASKKLAAQRDKEAGAFERSFRREMNSIDQATKKYSNYRTNLVRGYRQISTTYNNIAKTGRELLKTETKVARNRAENSARHLLQIKKERDAFIQAERAKIKNVFKAGAQKVVGFKFPEIHHLGRFLKITGIIAGVLDLVPFLGTGLNALGAGAIAAANGLGPLIGMLGTLPAALTTLGVFIGTSKLLFGGLGAAFKGGTSKADLKAQQAAMANLSYNAREFVLDVKSLQPAYKGLQQGAQNLFFDNLGPYVKSLGNQYLPLLNDVTGDIAQNLNLAAQRTLMWVQSSEGYKTINSVLKDANYEIGRGSNVAMRFGQVWLLIAKAAGPTMRLMSDDINNLSNSVYNYTSNNQDKISKFIMNGYKRFKTILGVVHDYGKGVVNIIKLSKPLTDVIGKGIVDGGNKFLAWTQDKSAGGGIEQITNYFNEMIGPFKAVVDFAGQFAKTLFRISQMPEFASLMNEITTKLLPALEIIFANNSGRFLQTGIDLIEGFAKLANSGVIGIIADTVGDIVDNITKFIDFITQPKYDAFRNIIVKGIVISVLFGSWLNLIKKLAFSLGGIIGSIIKIGWAARSGGFRGILDAFTGVDSAGREARTSARNARPVGANGGPATAAEWEAWYNGTAGGTRAEGKHFSDEPSKKGKSAKPRRAAGKSKSARGSMGAGAGAGLGLGGLAGTVGLVVGGQQIQNQIDKSATTNSAAAAMLESLNQNGNINALNGLAGNYSGSINNFGDLAKYYSDKKGFGNRFIDIASTGIGAITGTQNQSEYYKSQFASLDQALTELPASDAAKAFKQIQKAMQDAHVPTQRMIDLFPEYKDKVTATIDPLDKAGWQAQVYANAMAGVAGNLQTYAAQVVNVGNGIVSSTNSSGNTNYIATSDKPNGGFGRTINTARFAGGSLTAGQTSWTGELGPELAITKSGAMSLLGANGPQIYTPKTNTAIIPASATSDPMHGSYGMAPDWAKNALQGATGVEASNGTKTIPQNRKTDSGASQTPYNITFQVGSNAQAQNVAKEVKKVIQEIEKERRERSKH